MDSESRSRRFSFSSELSRHVGDEMERLLDFIARALPEACELEKCIIFLLDPKQKELVAKASNTLTPEELSTLKVSMKNEKGDVVIDANPFLSPDAQNDPRLVKEYVKKCNIKSLLTVPLKIRGKLLGVIHFFNSSQPHDFSSEEINFINVLASEVALAVESTLSEEERREKAEELERFRKEVHDYFTQIGKAITSFLDKESFIRLIADLSMRVVKADGSSLYLSHENSLQRELYLGVLPETLKDEATLPGVNDALTVTPLKEHGISWTVLNVPLKTQDESVGCLILYIKNKQEVSTEEIDVLSSFAAQAALAVKNISLFQTEKKNAEEISAVYEAAVAISAPLDLNQILLETAQRMGRLIGVNRSFIFLLDDERKILTAALVHGVSAEQKDFFSALAIPLTYLEGPLWERFKVGRPLIFNEEEIKDEVGNMKQLFAVFGTHRCLLAPLVNESRFIGLVYLDSSDDETHEFSEAHLRSIASLSIHAATSIERAQLYKQLEDQAKQVHNLYQISTTLSTTLHMDRILRLIAEKITQLVQVDRFCLWMWDENQNAFVINASRGVSEEFIKTASVTLEDRFVGEASSKKTPVYSPNILLETDNPHLVRLFKKEGLGAVLSVPFVTKRKTIGIVTLFAELGYQFKEKEIHLLGNFASHAALSIENARLYNLNRQKVVELGIIFDVGKRINEHLNPQEVLRSMAEQFISVMKSDGCSIMLVDKDEKNLSIQVTRGIARRSDVQKKIALGVGIVGKVVRSGHPVVLHDSDKEAGIPFPEALRNEGISTILAIPLATKEEMIGVVNLYTKAKRKYTPSEMHLMQTLAAQSAVALRNARVFEENYHVAQLIHRSLIPSHLPVASDLEFGFQYLPSHEISGDYYDFLELPGRLGITIADVSGKGTGAAIFTAQGKYAWKAYGMLESDPQKVVTLLNRLMVKNTPIEKFISLFYGVLDHRKKEFVYANAGHLPPILYRSVAKQCRYLNAPGLLLGIDEEAEFSKRSVTLHKGDILLFYTDGVSEARNEKRNIFGTERLEDILIENASHSAQMIANRILTAIRQFSKRRNSEDDITLVVVKMK